MAGSRTMRDVQSYSSDRDRAVASLEIAEPQGVGNVTRRFRCPGRDWWAVKDSTPDTARTPRADAEAIRIHSPAPVRRG